MSSLPLKDGAVVFDYCAGAGGKSMALLTQQHHGLSLALCDVHESRLSEARDRITQLGRGAAVDYVNLTHNPVADVNADLVIVDAPCSGSGLWFRKPDRRYLYEEQDLAKFLDKQLEILIKSSSCVKVGGYLLYITCSLFEEENEGVMQAFTQHTSTMWERKAFVSEMMPHYTDNALANNPAAGVGNDAPLCMKLLPWEHDSDGFYACLLKRTA